jgi:hypothetical protein
MEETGGYERGAARTPVDLSLLISAQAHAWDPSDDSDDD